MISRVRANDFFMFNFYNYRAKARERCVPRKRWEAKKLGYSFALQRYLCNCKHVKQYRITVVYKSIVGTYFAWLRTAPLALEKICNKTCLFAGRQVESTMLRRELVKLMLANEHDLGRNPYFSVLLPKRRLSGVGVVLNMTSERDEKYRKFGSK